MIAITLLLNADLVFWKGKAVFNLFFYLKKKWTARESARFDSKANCKDGNCQLSSRGWLFLFKRLKRFQLGGLPDARRRQWIFSDLPKLPFPEKNAFVFMNSKRCFFSTTTPLCSSPVITLRLRLFASALSSNKNNKPVVAHANRIGTEFQVNIYTTAGLCGIPLLESRACDL